MDTLDFDFLKKADEVTLRFEKSKKALEQAKIELENAKTAYDELFSQADQHGFNKAKLKKITEDRVIALLEVLGSEPKSEKPKKAKKIKEDSKNNEESTELELDSPIFN